MPSIFIWKATKPNTSKKTIKVYSGSNWMLEDNDYSSKSFMFLEQIVLFNNEAFNGSVITYNTKSMPQDWVGSELLEVTNVPYEILKDDTYGLLEQLGSWMRLTVKGSMNFDKDSLVSELTTIRNWIENPVSIPQKTNIFRKNEYKNNHSHNNYNQNNKNKYKQTNQNNNVIQQHLQIDHNKVQKDFQEFLIKFDLNKYTSNIPPIQSSLFQNVNKACEKY